MTIESETILVDQAPIERRSRLRQWLARLEGAQTVGRGPAFWAAFAVAVAAAVAYPFFSDDYTVGNTAYFLVWTFMAMGLCVVWGYGGALCFGQTAFFGLAGYAYGVLTINIGDAYGFTLVALVLAVGARRASSRSSSATSCSTARSAASSSASSPCR